MWRTLRSHLPMSRSFSYISYFVLFLLVRRDIYLYIQVERKNEVPRSQTKEISIQTNKEILLFSPSPMWNIDIVLLYLALTMPETLYSALAYSFSIRIESDSQIFISGIPFGEKFVNSLCFTKYHNCSYISSLPRPHINNSQQQSLITCTHVSQLVHMIHNIQQNLPSHIV